jgi:hypothetical protein
MDINSQDDEGHRVLHCMVQCHWNTVCGLGFGENIEIPLACGANSYLENLAGKIARQLLGEGKNREKYCRGEKTANAEEAFGIGVVII